MPTRNRKWVRQKNSHMATTYPRKAKCSQCNRVVLSGNVIGLQTLFDPYLLNQKGECEALIRGLRTFLASYPNFDRRTAHHIRAYPVPKYGFIIREHRCTAPEPHPKGIKHVEREPIPQECPF